MLNGSDNEISKFARKKWYVMDSELKGVYSQENPMKFLTSLLESILSDYSDVYVIVTGKVAALDAGDDTKAAFKCFARFRKCRTEINETFIDEAEPINVTQPRYNVIEYSDIILILQEIYCSLKETK